MNHEHMYSLFANHMRLAHPSHVRALDVETHVVLGLGSWQSPARWVHRAMVNLWEIDGEGETTWRSR